MYVFLGQSLSSGVQEYLCVILAKLSFVSLTVSISLSQEHGSLCSPIVLMCSFDNLEFVGFEEFVADGIRFSALTPYSISRNPDYEEVASDGLRKLRITQVERHNGTRYRCHGFTEDSEVFHSDEWKLVVPREFESSSCVFVQILWLRVSEYIAFKQLCVHLLKSI